MKEIDRTDQALLFELIKNSRKSDRELAKILHISQPTVTRRRLRIEKNLIDSYTTIPKWDKLGFELVAFTFFKMRLKYATEEERDKIKQRALEWCPKQPNIVLALGGQGMGYDGLCVSFHKSFSNYSQFKRNLDLELSDLIMDTESFIADLNPGFVLKALGFSNLDKAK
jgi:DNA-binding Lrp family transcriptional regulator